MEQTIKNSATKINEEVQTRCPFKWRVEMLVFDEFEKFLGETRVEKVLQQLNLKGMQIVLGSRVLEKGSQSKDEYKW
jgi:hypothetical protein